MIAGSGIADNRASLGRRFDEFLVYFFDTGKAFEYRDLRLIVDDAEDRSNIREHFLDRLGFFSGLLQNDIRIIDEEFLDILAASALDKALLEEFRQDIVDRRPLQAGFLGNIRSRAFTELEQGSEDLGLFL